MDEVNTQSAIYFDKEYQEHVLDYLNQITESVKNVTGSSIATDSSVNAYLDNITALNTFTAVTLSLIFGLLIALIISIMFRGN